MYIPPIREGPRMSKEEAVEALICLSFTKLEAVSFLKATTAAERFVINCKVQNRIKEEK